MDKFIPNQATVLSFIFHFRLYGVNRKSDTILSNVKGRLRMLKCGSQTGVVGLNIRSLFKLFMSEKN